MYGLLGKKLGHSYSKIIHECFCDYQYDLIEIEFEQLDEFFKQKNFKAVNVTIPYKQDVIKYLDYVDDLVKRIGACNSIVNIDGKLFGYNSDYYGFMQLLNVNKIDINNQNVIILGNGGATKAIECVLNDLNVKNIIKVKPNLSDETITYPQCYENYCDYDIIINTSGMGMYPNINQNNLDLTRFTKIKAVVDIVYNPIRTKLIMDADELNIKTVNGTLMLVAQAVQAINHFNGQIISDKKVENLVKKLENDKLNIVLIGMPSCGKSLIGKKIANKLKLDYYDSDQLIEDKTQLTCADIIQGHGIQYFRNIETNIIKDISLVNKSLISTGGGVILNSDNIALLKGNGILVFIDRDLDKLMVTNDRLLSNTADKLKQLYDQRIDLYKKYSDFIVSNNDNIDDCVNKIIEKVGIVYDNNN